MPCMDDMASLDSFSSENRTNPNPLLRPDAASMTTRAFTTDANLPRNAACVCACACVCVRVQNKRDDIVDQTHTYKYKQVCVLLVGRRDTHLQLLIGALIVQIADPQGKRIVGRPATHHTQYLSERPRSHTDTRRTNTRTWRCRASTSST